MIEVFNCEQYSPEWYVARLGIPTASEFHKLFMKGQKQAEASKTRRRYMLELVGERMTGQPRETYQSAHMQRGKDMEQQAADFYSYLTDEELESVGFIRNGKAGCSPDCLVGKNGMVQFKTMMAPLLLDLHLEGYKNDHECQQLGELWIAEREWSDLFIFWPGIKPLKHRVYRDETKIKSLELGVEMFTNELLELMTKLEAA